MGILLFILIISYHSKLNQTIVSVFKIIFVHQQNSEINLPDNFFSIKFKFHSSLNIFHEPNESLYLFPCLEKIRIFGEILLALA